MQKSITEFIEEFNATLEHCHCLLSIARDSDLQRSAIDSLSRLLGQAAGLKRQAREQGREDFANWLLGLECSASSLSSELRMWLLLKEEQPEEAWDCLIDAQRAAASATRAHSGFAHIAKHVARLEQIEVLVFPPQVYLSAGWIVGRQECSVCGSEYGQCEHLVGRPYSGKFCSIIARDLRGDHVAFVDTPADKKCRVTKFRVPGGERNRMTWAFTPREISGDETSDATDPGGLVFTGIIATTGS